MDGNTLNRIAMWAALVAYLVNDGRAFDALDQIADRAQVERAMPSTMIVTAKSMKISESTCETEWNRSSAMCGWAV